MDHIYSLKNTPSYEDVKSMRNGKKLRNYDTSRISTESNGLPDNEISEVINNYNLDKIYKVQTVKHSHEMLEILKKNFN